MSMVCGESLSLARLVCAVLEKILDVDMGNSRVKWRHTSGQSGVIRNEEFATFCGVELGSLDRIRVACVAEDEFKKRVLNFLEEKYLCKPEIALSESGCAGLVNKYKNPRALGVDRWLACLAAWRESEKNAVLIVDAGSAITIDTVNDKSEFVGGYIIPGLEMMQKALVGNTGQIACGISAQFCDNYNRLPTSTNEAVQRGSCFAVLASVERAVRQFLQQWPDGRVYFTGGYGAEIAQAVEMAECYRQDLVLEGLAMALP